MFLFAQIQEEHMYKKKKPAVFVCRDAKEYKQQRYYTQHVVIMCGVVVDF
jgi:hypothetical protein